MITLLYSPVVIGMIGFMMGLFIHRLANYYAHNLTPQGQSTTSSLTSDMLVGLACAMLSLVNFYFIGHTLWAWLTVLLIWSLCLLLLMDLKTWLLPDLITLPLMWLGLIVHDLGLGSVSLHDALWGAVLGYVFPWLIKHLYFLLTDRQGMGHGDFKLLAALGAWLGWQALPVVLLIASCAGLVVGLMLMWWRKKTLKMAVPFGPFLAFAGVLILFKQGH
ncbi:type 4 prepilin-like proteins leader peptide-processing enzyme [Ferrovum sp. PN-J185]|nr:type 4 prepilin-like proteins leader peptide-processing enzyme [Ferrovum sp. PN-J185]